MDTHLKPSNCILLSGELQHATSASHQLCLMDLSLSDDPLLLSFRAFVYLWCIRFPRWTDVRMVTSYQRTQACSLLSLSPEQELGLMLARRLYVLLSQGPRQAL